MEWIKLERPGYFGRRRDEKIAALDAKYGKGNWTIIWDDTSELHSYDVTFGPFEFEMACKRHYENSYLCWFADNPEELDFVCLFGECIDNAITNIQSGRDYTKQEAFSTHIQDIAIRNVLHVFSREFEGPKDKILIIRSADSEGYKYGPGNIPYINPSLIQQPSLAPQWAQKGSVEDFWQSNKYIAIKAGTEK